MDLAIRSYRRKRFALILILIFLIIVFLVKIYRTGDSDTLKKEVKFNSSVGNYIPSSDSDNLSFKGKVRRGDNLFTILSSENLDNSLIIEIISKTGEIYDLRKIKAGNNYLINHNADGFQSFRYDIEKNKYIELFISESGEVESKIVVIPYEIRIELIGGVINGSLYETLVKTEKGGGELAEHLATLYEYDIDFNRDIRKGDSFLILLEKRYLDGEFSGYGKIIASEFINRGKKTSVVRFASDPGKSSYYHPDGRAVKKMFLRCPLPFMRLTSRFGFRRHPVTGFSAAHNGIDLGALRGTTVRATADGRIYQAGYDRVRGRYIVMSHGNKYRTHYYHLSGIKKGIRRGKWVTQGNVIGYVGNTGRSTGPHLHYGLQRSGRYLNPLRLNSPSREPVKKKDRERFDNSAGVIFTLVKIGKSNILNNTLKQFIYRSTLEIIGNNI